MTELVQLFGETIVEVPIRGVPVLRNADGKLFTGKRYKRNEYEFTRRYEDELPEDQVGDDVNPQTQFLRESRPPMRGS